MVMQETVKVEDSMGKINISPSQVAFIVDHCANNLSQTRATLRMEAPSLFAASPFGKSSNTSFNLAKILADYISLRREKMILDQERCAIVQEKCRIQNLMEDMHNAVNTYNAFQRPIPVNVPVSNVPSATFHQNPSGVCTATTTAYVQNTNPCNVQLYKKRKNSEPINEPTIPKRPRGRPPGKKNQHRGLQVLPLSTNQAQISTNSPILETHPVMITNQFFQPASTTCNEVLVSHGQNRVMVVDPEREITSKDSFHNSLINSDTNQHSSPMPQSLKNSIPNEVSTLHKATQNDQNDQSHMDLSHIDFALDTGYWSNFSLGNMETLDGIFSDHPPPSTHSQGNA